MKKKNKPLLIKIRNNIIKYFFGFLINKKNLKFLLLIISGISSIIYFYYLSYDVTNKRYENRYKFINDNVNSFKNKLISTDKKNNIITFQYLSKYQQLRCPIEPVFLDPISVFKSFFYRKYESKKYIDRFINPNELYIDFPRITGDVNPYIYKNINEILESLKTNLNQIKFIGIDFFKIQLYEGNLNQIPVFIIV